MSEADDDLVKPLSAPWACRYEAALAEAEARGYARGKAESGNYVAD